MDIEPWVEAALWVALAGMVGRGDGAPGNCLCGRRLKKARNLFCSQQHNVLPQRS